MNEDRATRYHRLKRRAVLTSLAWSIGLLTALIATGLSVSLRTASESAAEAVAAGRFAFAAGVAFYVIGLSLVYELGSLPIACYGGFLLERRYGLSTGSLGGWLKDRAKSFAVNLTLGAGSAIVLYALIRISPDRWWLPAGAGFALVTVGLTNLAPVVLLPLFYRIPAAGP